MMDLREIIARAIAGPQYAEVWTTGGLAADLVRNSFLVTADRVIAEVKAATVVPPGGAAALSFQPEEAGMTFAITHAATGQALATTLAWDQVGELVERLVAHQIARELGGTP